MQAAAFGSLPPGPPSKTAGNESLGASGPQAARQPLAGLHLGQLEHAGEKRQPFLRRGCVVQATWF